MCAKMTNRGEEIKIFNQKKRRSKYNNLIQTINVNN